MIFLFKIRKVLIGLVMVGLGLLLGYLFSSSQETVELTISLLVIFLILPLIIHKPLNGVLLWLFFMAFLEQWIEIPLGAGLPDLSFSRFIIVFLGISMLAKGAIGKFRFARLSSTDLFIVLTTLGIIISAPLISNPKAAILEAISMHFTPLVVYFFAKNLVKSKEDLHQLLLTIAIFGFVAGAYAIFEFTTGHVLFLPKGKIAEELRLYRGNSEIRLIQGLLGGTGIMGRALSITIPVTFYLFLEYAKKGLQKILLAGMIGIQFYGIVIAMSRTPWYSLLLALFLMQFFYPQFRKVFYAIAFAGLIVLWATWNQVSDSQISERINQGGDTYSGRTPRWEAAIEMWKVKPIRGWGLDRFNQESGRFRQDGSRQNLHAVENDYLHILVSTGLLGLGPYVIFLLLPLINSLRLFFRARAPDWPGFITPQAIVIYWAVILCLIINSYTAKVSNPVIKLMPLAVAGAVVGSHESLLVASKKKQVAQTAVVSSHSKAIAS